MPSRKILDQATLEELIVALGSKNYRERRDAVNKLGKFRDPRAQEWLIRALKDRTLAVRRRAVVALSQYKDPALLPYMLPLLKDNTCKSHRIINKLVLDMGLVAEPYLLAVLQDKNRLIRCAAAQLLAEIGSQQAIEPLIALLNPQSHEDSFFVMMALKKLGSPLVVEPLLEILQNEKAVSEVRRTAAIALTNYQDSRVTDLYLTLLKHPTPLLRATAVRCLIEQNPPPDTLIPLLQEATHDPDKQVSYQAFRGLESLASDLLVIERTI